MIEMTRTVGKSDLVLRTGEYGAQADACLTLQYGKTVVLCAVVDGGIKEGFDFMPLLVDYRERFYAAGKILGSRFVRRESRPRDHEVLTARMMDRSIRPTFPKGYRRDTQVSAVLLSSDGENPAEPVAVNAATMALALAGIPIDMELTCARVAKVGDEYVLFPTNADLAEASFEILISATREKVLMIELGGQSAPEAEVCAATAVAHDACRGLLDMLDEMRQAMGVERRTFELEKDEATSARVTELAADRIAAALSAPGKANVHAQLELIRDEVVAEVAGEDGDVASKAKDAYEEALWRAVRRRAMDGNRDGGRACEDLRPIDCRVGVLPCSHGSAVFKRGQTQVLAAATLGGFADRQMMEMLHGDENAPFMLHYNFPAFSVGEIKPERGPSRRDIGHGNLARKAMESVVPDQEAFGYTIRIVAEVMESCASSSMATVCATTLALMDAGVPIKAPVAGISIGLVELDGEYRLLSDLHAMEDHYGDMDFKVAGTAEGITAIQMDVKNDGLTAQQIAEALDLAKRLRLQVLDTMAATLAAPRDELSPLAPRVGTVKIPVDKIGILIGPGGKNVRGLQEEHEVGIDVEEDGTVYVSGTSPEGFDKVVEYLKGLAREPEVGETYSARVVSIKDFGAFMEFLPGTEGLLHISEIEYRHVEKVEEVLHMGDVVDVKLVGMERDGKFRLSRKALLPKPEGYVERERPPRGDRPPRRDDRGGHGDRGGRPRR